MGRRCHELLTAVVTAMKVFFSRGWILCHGLILTNSCKGPCLCPLRPQAATLFFQQFPEPLQHLVGFLAGAAQQVENLVAERQVGFEDRKAYRLKERRIDPAHQRGGSEAVLIAPDILQM